MKTTIITFSPTGGTQKCAEILAQNIGETMQKIDLTDRNLGEISVCEESDVVILAVPSYGGRMPLLAVERLKKIDGRGKNAVLLVVYGNRAFEDTLVEMEDTAKAQNFKVVAAVAAIAQHCMDGKIATGRPDAEDIAKLNDFGKKIAEKLAPKPTETTVSVQCPAVLLQGIKIPGNRPYKKAGPGMQPKTDKTCTACGLCARQCPVGAISAEDCKKIDTKKCLGCMRCVSICPLNAKHLSTSNRLLAHAFLSLVAGKRKEPELFI